MKRIGLLMSLCADWSWLRYSFRNFQMNVSLRVPGQRPCYFLQYILGTLDRLDLGKQGYLRQHPGLHKITPVIVATALIIQFYDITMASFGKIVIPGR